MFPFLIFAVLKCRKGSCIIPIWVRANIGLDSVSPRRRAGIDPGRSKKFSKNGVTDDLIKNLHGRAPGRKEKIKKRGILQREGQQANMSKVNNLGNFQTTPKKGNHVTERMPFG